MNAELDYIRQAIAREEYAKALAQWNDYVRHVRRALESGSLSAGQMQEARALYEWARPVLLSARAHLRDRIHEIEVAAAYTFRQASSRGRLDTHM